ncbi:hypothetical protein PsorP6_012723 [Peronosclerospora sorghi]|uniref:Uncharacterized protein n=1 Tax=Peronosclerospora sorghi TaxID=230839 RepID=A0ACC0WHD2_9STRA|nr:hypothetical protein PsorP6_012723 [Peronosclerospora sorghi]
MRQGTLVVAMESGGNIASEIAEVLMETQIDKLVESGFRIAHVFEMLKLPQDSSGFGNRRMVLLKKFIEKKHSGGEMLITALLTVFD